MHILFLTDNFPPEVNAPASRTFEHCREWVKAGHQVTVITCAPNFPQGRVHAGYRNCLWQCENMDDITVIRVWTYLTANEGVGRRILDYASFMVGATAAGFWIRNVDLVIGTSPQLFTVCAAFLVGRLKRIPFVFELRDFWPESIIAVGALRASLAVRMLGRVSHFLYRRAAMIVVVTHSFKRTLVNRGIPEVKITVITNGVDLERFKPRPKDADLVKKLRLENRLVAGYIGTHGMAHGLETILAAADRLRANACARRIVFLLLGDGALKSSLIKNARDLDLDNVIFLDSVPRDEVIRYWSLLDVSIIHLKKSEVFTTVIPSKLFESLAMGIPVVHGVSGESAEIVEKEGIGLVFEPESAEALCEKLLLLVSIPLLFSQLQAHCLDAAKKFDRTVLARAMLESLEGLVIGQKA